VLLLETLPLMRGLADEWLVDRQFPLLSDFETPFEVDRWQHEKPLRLERTITRHGETSLRVQLTTSKYSTASLRYFHHDWSGYDAFNFSLFNTGNDTVMMTCRINDIQHYKLGQNYHDRFNRRIYLAPGWNDFKIPLAEIINAPKSRKMDIHQINLICFFSMSLAEPRNIYIDHIYLDR